MVWHEHSVWVPWRASVERPVICSERFAGAVAHERVVPVLSVEGRPRADDPAVLSDEPGNEFTFRFNRRFYPFNAFRSLLGIAGDTSAPTYAELYSGEWRHPTCSGHGR